MKFAARLNIIFSTLRNEKYFALRSSRNFRNGIEAFESKNIISVE
jgi:hypothetical protein